MAEHTKQDQVVAQREEWTQPAMSRMNAGEAEVSGATSDDGVIGNS